MKKKPVILIVCVAILIIALVLLVIYMANGGSTDIKDLSNNDKKTQGNDEIVLKLSAYPEEETEGDVEISISATISGGNEILSIKMPDGKTIGYTPDIKYPANKNGDYSFTVKASNGKEKTETISINNIIAISADNPYVPDGFKHLDETQVSSGFVIEDKFGNQYVWVPVESGNLTRTAPSEKYFEENYTSSAFNNSVAKYQGFYIAKYESSKDIVNGIVVSKSVKDVLPWSNVNYDDAFNAARNTATAYNYIGVKTALINSYAWDTTLSWLNTSVTNYSTSRSFGNYSNQILNTGATESDIVNEISDMSGNLREWTTEKYDENIVNEQTEEEETNNSNNNNKDENETIDEISYRVIRGGSATMDKIANSRIGERTDLQDSYWGFRMVLYKE